LPNKITLSTLSGSFNLTNLNQNFSDIQSFINDEALSRTNSAGAANTMGSDLDLNSNDLLNGGHGAFSSLTVNGVDFTVDPGSITPVALSQMSAGTAAAPGLPFTNDTNTGLYRIGADNLGVACNGAKVLDVSTSGLGVTGTLTTSGAATVSAGGLTVSAGGITVSAGGLNVTGTVTLPSHTLANGTTATTQSASDNSTKVATTAYVDTAVGAVSLPDASQAEMEAASSTTKAVTPGRIKYSPHVAQVKGRAAGTASTGYPVSCTTYGLLNVSAVQKTAAGTYKVTFTTAMSDTNYTPIVNVVNSSANTICCITDIQTGYFTFEFRGNLSGSLGDPTGFSFAVFGDFA
jgi:hypothetical protein